MPIPNTCLSDSAKRRFNRALLLTASALLLPTAAHADIFDIFGSSIKKYLDLATAVENGSERAYETLRDEANKGNKQAALQFGYLNHAGLGPGGKNLKVAIKAYRIAVGTVGDDDKITGNRLAAYNMGLIYLQGDLNGVPDAQQALKWFRAAIGNSMDTNFLLPVMHIATLYEKGMDPIAANPTEAVKWYKLGAKMRDSIAQFKLGKALILGTGTSIDYVQGLTYLKIAADKWHRPAMYFLAEIYAKGGAYQEQNLFEAAKWLLVAAIGNDQYKPASDAMLALLPAKEQERAVKASRSWMAGHLTIPTKVNYDVPLNAESEPQTGSK